MTKLKILRDLKEVVKVLGAFRKPLASQAFNKVTTEKWQLNIII